MSAVDVLEVLDDPHFIAVQDGLASGAFDEARAVEILTSCGYTPDEARAALARVGGPS